MDPRQTRHGPDHILYDASRLPEPEPALFDPVALERAGRLQGRPGGGRGSACFVEVAGIPAVLRPYRRGGLLAPLLGDRYARTRLHRARPWREWWLLARLHAEGIPVPAPLAARVRPCGPWYRADILTERLAAEPLAEVLRRRAVTPAQWRAIGACIGRLHRRGVEHADLNAHNILLGEDGRVAIIDLDRARVRAPGAWAERNLARLRRSLSKLAAADPGLAEPDRERLDALHEGWRHELAEEQPHAV